MRTAPVCALLAWSTGAIAGPGYAPVFLGGGDVAIRNANDRLKDWRVEEGAPHVLHVHDATGQWYRVRLKREPGCAFAAGSPPVSGYGTDLQHLFGAGLWVQNSAYPYRRCRVRSTRPIATPPDQIGVDYAAEYQPTVHQVIAQKIECRKRVANIWTRPIVPDRRLATMCD